jgi:isopentenyl diphosphate isomerase/L-lactate dehydrogenase-like FMN-dependent dehydrogenase
VKSVYAHLTAELRSAMMLSGVARVTEIKREHLALSKSV